MNPLVRVFLWGLLGGFAMELLKVNDVYEAGKPLPARYRRKGFLVAKSMLILLGGAFAIAFDVKSDSLAVAFGASMPALFEQFTQRLPREPKSPDRGVE